MIIIHHLVNKPGKYHLNQMTEVNNIISNGAEQTPCAPGMVY